MSAAKSIPQDIQRNREEERRPEKRMRDGREPGYRRNPAEADEEQRRLQTQALP